ncbi:MAG: immunoglobulin domain-containing protein, partial [Opitutaceae bacterium]|nr:immunoglobulin domain-containing protein [Opitutaceae bacterium]
MPIMRIPILTYTALVALSAHMRLAADVTPIVLLDECFPSDTRTLQNPPDSAAWFTQTPAAVSADATARALTLNASAGGTTSVVAYVPSLRLPVGDKLALACDITLPGGALSQADDALLVSLLNTKGIAANRTTADGAAPRYNTSTGYTLGINPDDPVMRAPGQTDSQPSLSLRRNPPGSAPVSQLPYSAVNETFGGTNPTAAPWRPISTDSKTWYASVPFSSPNTGISQNGSLIRFRAGGFVVTHFDRVSIDNAGDTFKVTINANITDNGDAGATTITSILAGLFDTRSTALGPGTATEAQIQGNTFTADGNPAVISSLGIIAGAINITQNTATAGVWLRDAGSDRLFTRNTANCLTSGMSQGIRGNYNRFEITYTRLDNGRVDVAVAISQAPSANGNYALKHSMHYDGLDNIHAFDTLALDIGRAAGFMDLDDIKLELIQKPVTLATTSTLTPSLTAGGTCRLEFEIHRAAADTLNLTARLDGESLAGPVELQAADTMPGATNPGDFLAFDTIFFSIKNAGGAGAFPTLKIAGIMLSQIPLGARPEIIQQPASMIRSVGGAAAFEIAATGGGLTYQWCKDGIPLAGRTGAALDIAGVAMSDAGFYTCVITNDTDASVTSEAALLRVIDTAEPAPEPDGFAG